jgi:hypothetical protein
MFYTHQEKLRSQTTYKCKMSAWYQVCSTSTNQQPVVNTHRKELIGEILIFTWRPKRYQQQPTTWLASKYMKMLMTKLAHAVSNTNPLGDWPISIGKNLIQRGISWRSTITRSTFFRKSALSLVVKLRTNTMITICTVRTPNPVKSLPPKTQNPFTPSIQCKAYQWCHTAYKQKADI